MVNKYTTTTNIHILIAYVYFIITINSSHTYIATRGDLYSFCQGGGGGGLGGDGGLCYTNRRLGSKHLLYLLIMNYGEFNIAN